MLDSLNKYEFLKARTTLLRNDLQNAQTEKLGLKLQLSRANNRADNCQQAAGETAKNLAEVQAKLKASRTENWVFRGVAALVLLKTAADLLSVFK